MTKKIIVIAAALGLAACSGSSNSSGSSGSTGTPTSSTTSSSSSSSTTSTSSGSGSGSGSGSTSSTTGSGSGSGSSGTTGSGSNSGSTGLPTPPTLGTQIDRMGRPAVNTALTDPFDDNPSMSENAVKDAYNADSNASAWRTTWTGAIASNMAIYDGVNASAFGIPDGGTSCGDQALAGGDTSSPTAQYGTVAGVLADDELYLNVSNTTCTMYLAVELASQGLTNSDCGGRTPTEDVVDLSYSILTMPQLLFLSNGPVVTDGIASDDQTTGQNAPSTTFPFMGAPN